MKPHLTYQNHHNSIHNSQLTKNEALGFSGNNYKVGGPTMTMTMRTTMMMRQALSQPLAKNSEFHDFQSFQTVELIEYDSIITDIILMCPPKNDLAAKTCSLPYTICRVRVVSLIRWSQDVLLAMKTWVQALMSQHRNPQKVRIIMN